jgi:hypothetical protein
MRRAAVEHAEMNVGASCLCETLEEVFGKFGLKAADRGCREFCFHHAKGPAAKIDGCRGQGFIHGHQKVPGAENAAFVSESGVDRFAEGDADIFDGVMLVDIEVAGGFQAKIETTMAGHQIEHVVEKTDTGRYFGFASAVEIQAKIDLRFLRFASDVSGSKH